MKQLSRPIQFLRTTAIGGLLFLLPLIVVGALVGQVVPIVWAVAESLASVLPGFIKTPGGISLLFLLSIAILLLLCFVAGIIATNSFSRSFSDWFEKKLVLLFPRYAIIKDQMADTIGGDQNRARMVPVLVQFDDHQRVAFETERNEESGLVAIFLPGSPDPWAGRVVLLSSERVEAIDLDFGDTAAICEQLGRGSTSLVMKTSTA